MSVYQGFKLWLQDWLHLAKDALHIHIGLALFLGAALVFGWSLKSWRPWLLVLVAALAGEVWDLRDTLVFSRPVPWFGQAKDIVNTMLWPTVLMMLARSTRLLRRS